jgi:protein-disulfide isomerase
VQAVPISRRAFNALISLGAVAALTLLPPFRLIAIALNASDVAKPVSLPDMALGAPNAPITITEYAAATCPHCVAFNREVFPKIKAAYVDTGKVRYVFREFPLNIKDAACSMVARSIARDDAGKYFAVVDVMFRQQDALVQKTTDTLKLIGRQAGLSAQAVEDCLKDEALLNKIKADRKYAEEVLKIEGTPTFFINGDEMVGEVAFEEFDKKIRSLLKS